MTLSYAIPVCNEWIQLEYLLNYLFKHKREQDEIIVQCDKGNTTPSVYDVLKEYSNHQGFKVIEFPLNKDFASFKNNLKDACSGDYIFQIDADEYPDDYLMSMIEPIIEMNESVDIFWVPRINKVEGLTQEHIDKWRWNVGSDNRINFPDYQCRILKNTKEIKWENKVHEILSGYKTESHLPTNDEYCLIHLKDIKRQEKQNELYSKL
jgi:glycosyltransferase involved in cell wall biosynthesis